MNTLLKKYRLLLALTTGFLVLALQCSGAASVFARGVAAGGVTHATTSVITTDPAICSQTHNNCYWADNEATGTRGTYREATVEFTVPQVLGVGTVFFGAGLGGEPGYGGPNFEGVVAGIQSTPNPDDPLAQPNVPSFQVWPNGASNNNPHPLPSFPVHINVHDKIKVDVRSNLNGVGYDKIIITDVTQNNASNTPYIIPDVSGGNAPVSDGATGECFAERFGALGVQEPIAEWYGLHETLSNCSITNNAGTTHNVGNWPTTDWNHLINTSGTILVRVGALTNNNADFDVIWVQGS